MRPDDQMGYSRTRRRAWIPYPSMSDNSENTREAALARAAQRTAEGRTSEAEKILRQALSNYPDDSLLWFRLGSLYLHTDKFADAAGAFRRALKSDPENPLVLNDLGYALERAGDPEDAGDAYGRALAVVDRALEEQPDMMPGVLALGEISENRGQTERALEYYRRALACEPSNAEALLRSAYLEMNRCRFDAAVTNFRTYVRKAPSDEQALMSLGVCLQETGRTGEALKIYRRLLAEDRSRYYAVVKNLISSARGVIWLRADELKRKLLPDDT